MEQFRPGKKCTRKTECMAPQQQRPCREPIAQTYDGSDAKWMTLLEQVARHDFQLCLMNLPVFAPVNEL